MILLRRTLSTNPSTPFKILTRTVTITLHNLKKWHNLFLNSIHKTILVYPVKNEYKSLKQVASKHPTKPLLILFLYIIIVQTDTKTKRDTTGIRKDYIHPTELHPSLCCLGDEYKKVDSQCLFFPSSIKPGSTRNTGIEFSRCLSSTMRNAI